MHPENLRKGMMIVITDVIDDEPPEMGYHRMESLGGYTSHQRQFVNAAVSGWPLKVVAVSIPFICVEYDGTRMAVDIRRVKIRQVSSKYAKAMLREPPRPQKPPEDKPVGIMTDDALVERGFCPRCRHRIHMASTVSRGWFYKCPECGWEGDIPVIA